MSNWQREFSDGWLVLLASFVGVGCGVAALSFYTTGIFMTPLQEEFGWSRAALSLQGLFAVAVLVVVSPFIGLLIDRVGIRLVGSLSLAFFAVGLFATSFLFDSLIFLYALSVSIAFLGSGSTPVTFTRAITGWFDKSRGLALGIALLGAGVSSALVPLLLTDFVAQNGWRTGYRALALVVLVAAVFVGLFLKDDPQTVRRAKENAKGGPPLQAVPGMTVPEVRKTPILYIMALIFLLVALAVSGMIVHFIPMLNDTGLNPTQVGQLASLMGLSIMVGRLGAGFLIDRFFAPHIAALLFGLSALGYLTFILGGVNFAAVAAIAVGLSMGAEVDLIGFLVSRYFGLRSYGAIYGLLYSVFLIGGAVSQFLFGLIYDQNGDYAVALVGSAAALGLATILTFFLPSYAVYDCHGE